MQPRVWISEMQFSDGSNIYFEKNDIIVFVGPNNAGKSASLKEAATLLANREQKGKVLKEVVFEKEGDNDDLLAFLNEQSLTEVVDKINDRYRGYGYDFHTIQARHRWENFQEGIKELFQVFANILTTSDRLTAAHPAPNIKLTSEVNKHPIHFLQKDDKEEKRFSEYFRQAFGTDLIVHRNAGNEVPLYIGEKPIPKPGDDRVSDGYLRELETRELLHGQGDGMKSFVGVMLNAFISNYCILFIDEPEAFLHPPQARLMGKMLAKDLPKSKQLFLATHSEDFLKGLLDSNASNLKIIRIHREGSINIVNVLNSSDIEEIWSNSLLRHSDILNGLFHSKVVICESDSDCRFYSAILSAQYEDTNQIAPDILFVHCGGKHRVPTVIKSLRKLNVPLKVVCDFDVLNDIAPLKDIYVDLGGTWAEVEADWSLVRSEIERKKPELPTADVKKEIEAILHSTTELNFPNAKVEEIKRILKKASAWSQAKEIGKAFIPSGNATQAFERMKIKFKEKGFHILEGGELEGFAKSIGKHGPKWVADVLTKDLKNDLELEGARKFVAEISG